jgi:DNA repair photolyase
MVGTGGAADPPAHDADYRRGYLCGTMRGDGARAGACSFRGTNGATDSVHILRIALSDTEALARVERFLAQASVLAEDLEFSQGYASHRAMTAIGTRRRGDPDLIRGLVVRPDSPSLSWVKGFLAGLFDAGGSCSSGIWRLSDTEPEDVDFVRACLSRLQFRHVVEQRSGETSAVSIRLLGGLPERLRFAVTTDPAITRKRTVLGEPINGDIQLSVRSVRPVGAAMMMIDITTTTGDFIADGVVSHNCFARPTHTYLDFGAGSDFERKIVVKVNAPERLRAELRRPSWKHEHVALGTNTDPYQWVESRYRLMPGIWEALRDAANPCSILTKSPLLLRDLPLMLEIADRADFSAALSVPTLEPKAWRATEPHTPHPRARLEAVAELARAGIRTGVLVAPLMPGINDDPRQVERILELAAEAGADYVSGIALHLRGEVRKIFMDWLRARRPELVSLYQGLYARGASAPAAERRRLGGLVHGRLDTSRTITDRGGGPREDDATRHQADVGAPPLTQPRLF